MNNALAGIYTITPLHCGTGQAVGAIDLPIARERHTGHPLIPATSLKGKLREIAFSGKGKNAWGNDWESIAEAIFGPDVDKGDDHAGAATFTDARIAAFPVRSLQAVFYWVTCPMVLQRCVRDMRAAEIPARVPEVSPLTDILASGPAPDNSHYLLILEDLAYPMKEEQWNFETAVSWAQWLQKLLPDKEPNSGRLLKHLVILSDEEFTDLVTRTTPVAARIKLNSAKTTGKVERTDEEGKEITDSGNLWYEETLPPDCLFYSLLLPQNACGSKALEASDIKKKLKQLCISPVQIGGNETIGQGWCHWHWVQEETNERTHKKNRRSA